MPRIALALSLAVLAAAGCRFGQLPDPNKEKAGTKFDGAALQTSVRRVDEVLTDRLAKGEISRGEKDDLFKNYIRDQVEGIVPEEVPNDQAWRYADVYRQLGEWETTDELYERAVSFAKDDDRRVNDTLRLAEAKAHLGQVEKGIELVRSTFGVPAQAKAPILMATLYEFAPAAMGQGADMDVAKLLEEAMQQHLLTVVDPKSAAGAAFLQARVYHLRQAWRIVVGVYREHGSDEDLKEAIKHADEMLERFKLA